MDILKTFSESFLTQVTHFVSFFFSILGSANIWINSAKCVDSGCTCHKQYNGTLYPNYVELNFDLDVQFGTGELVGKINSDHMYVAGVEV